MFLGCFFLVACVSLRCETSIHPGSALFRLCQGICNIWFLLLQVRKKMCRVSGSLVGCSFSTSVERGMISDSLPVRLRVSAQELLSLLVLADPLWVLFVALHCWEELEVRASELINEGEFTERWVKSQLSSLLKMHCWGVLYLGDPFVEEGRAQHSKQFTSWWWQGLWREIAPKCRTCGLGHCQIY